ncbi:MAG TPA: AMP-binding protein [Candidatus Binatia bacterium]|nr:AMP-binding protein [Candidatus Binatia bacterium]
MSALSLVDPLRERATREPERRALVFVAEDGTRRDVTAAALDADAGRWARGLAGIGIVPGDVILLSMGHSCDLIGAFLGTLYLDAVPCVLPYPGERLDVVVYGERVRAACDASAARAVVSSAAFAPRLRAYVGEAGCRVLAVDEILGKPLADDVPRNGRRAGDASAFLQFTSGTTGPARAIVHTHCRVLEMIAAKDSKDQYRPGDVVVSWLPLYHDLGLVSGLLTPLVIGVPTVLIAPLHWVRDPRILFTALHEFGGTHCWMPNFALNHCARHVRDRDLEGIDLGRWRALVLGGEPVRLASLELFAERFRAYGFREGALIAGYGMAENIEGATATVEGRPPRVDWVCQRTLHEDRRAVPAEPRAAGSTPIISCGFPLAGTEVVIASSRGQWLPERHVGEIALRSAYMFPGYHRRPDLTAAAIHDGWFHTGDLGYLADGELYVCGRKKDLIIVGGRNINPEDIETVADAVEGIRPGRSVAFGVDDERLGSERAVLLCELRDAKAADASVRLAVERELRQCVVCTLDLALGDVGFVEPGWIVKTSSGKLARAANREKYLRERATES